MQMTTVFDGILPASLNPGIDPGEPVVVWTPTVSGIFRFLVSAPDEPLEPFATKGDVLVDMNGGGIINGLLSESSPGDIPFQETPDPYPQATGRLSTFEDHDVRVVVKVGLLASTEGIEAGDTSIVPLDELKLALGLDPLSTDDDLLLTLLEQQAAAYVEAQIGRRFSVPTDRTEFIKGLGVETLFLGGHAASGIQSVRARARTAREFDDVDEEDYDVRGDTLVLLGGRWSHLYEYEVVYADGYDLGSAPADIRALVIDLVSIAFSGLGEEGVKSESIGDYSYTLDSAVTAAAASFSDASIATINRYRRSPI